MYDNKSQQQDSPQQQAAALKQHKPSLEYLRLVQADWLRREQAYGDGHNTALVRLIMIAWMEDRPHDISSLAAALRLSRQQTTRRAEAMVARGLLTFQRRRNRVVVQPTDALIEETAGILKKRLPEQKRKWERWLAMLVTSMM